MTDINNIYVTTPTFIAILANILAYRIKQTLKENGYEISYFSGHTKDVSNIFKLAKNTTNTQKRKKYFFMGYSILGLTALFVLSIFLFLSSIPSFGDNACNTLNDFRRKEYNYVVIDKYLDTAQHSYKTLILQDKKGRRQKHQEFVMDNSTFFDDVNIGDTLIKANNDIVIHLKNLHTDKKYTIDFGCQE